MLKKPNQRKEATQNKSFADVFDSMLTDWKKFISFLSMLFCILALVFISFMAMNKYSGSTIKEINLSATGSKVLFEAKAPDGKTQYVLVVHPQGWQNTKIRIDKKSKLSFKTDGSVNIDGGGLVRTIMNRRNREDQIEIERDLKKNLVDEKHTPEYYFSDKEKNDFMLQRPWVDPDGIPRNTTDEHIVSLTYSHRADRLELKGENLGCLIGKISDSEKNTQSFEATQSFKIGKELELISQTSGDLWLNVNDVKNLQTDLRQQMFYQDNLGFFWVVLTIDPN